MKRFSQIIVVIVFIYALVGFFVVPNILQDEITKNAETILKRKVSIETVSFNPFSFEVRLKNLIVHNKGEGRTLAGMKELVVNIDPLYLVLGEIKVSKVLLKTPFLTLHKDKNGKLNFIDLLESESNTTQTSSQEASLPKIVLEKFAIRQGKLNFIDETGSKVFSETLRPINFTLRDFSTMQEHKNQLSLHIEIDDGTYVDYKGKINRIEPLALEGNLELHSGRLYTQWKYFQDVLGFIVADGSLDASLSYSADFAQEKAKIYINQYQVKIDKLRLQDKQSRENIFNLPSLRLSGEADIAQKKVKVDQFAIKDFSIKAKRDKNGVINWLDYLPSSDEKTKESNVSEKNPWEIEVSQFDLGMKNSSFEEHYAPKAYRSSFEVLSLALKDVKINAQATSIPFIALDISKMTSASLQTQDKPILYLESMHVAAKAELKAQDFNISELGLDGMKINISKDAQARLSYLDYLPYQKTQEEPKESSAVKWEVKTFDLNNSSVNFSNNFDAINALTKLDNIDLRVNNLSSKKGSWSNSKLKMNVNKSATVTINSEHRQSPLRIKSRFNMKNLDLVKWQAYVSKRANIDINSAKMNLDFKLKHDEKHTDLVANVQMSDVNMSERKEGKPFFAFSKLVVKDIGLSLNPDQIKIAKIDIYNAYARVKIDANKSTNLEGLMLEDGDKKEDQTDSKPFPVFISKVNFKGGTGEFSDLSLPLPFKTNIHDLKGKVIGLGTLSDIKSRVDLDGTVDEYGLMKVEGALLSANPKVFTDMGVRFENIDMTNLSPYTGKFIGYKLKEGKMNVQLSYKINDSQMQGANRIILKKMNLGDEVESEDAISAPVGLAIALLKDGDGVIDLDVPVSGNVDEPEFAIGSVVWTAFKNLITGVATAPFRFLANSLGISEEALENIQFEAGKYALLPPQKETLDTLSSVLSEKKMLTLKIAGTYDVKRDELAMKTALIYEEALQKIEDKTTDISKMDREKLDELLQEMYVSHYSKEKFDALDESIDEKEISSEEKEVLLREAVKKGLIEVQKVSKEDLVKLAKRRAESIISYLVLKGVVADRLHLENAVEVNTQIQEDEYIPTKLELGTK